MARIKLHYPEHTLYSHTLTVRITDLNYGNHLGHDTLISLLHEARCAMLHHFGLAELDAEQRGLIMAELVVNYQAEAFYADRLCIDIGVGEIGRKGFELLYRVRKAQDDTLVALAKTGMVCFDYRQRRPIEIPETYQALLQGELEAPGSRP